MSRTSDGKHLMIDTSLPIRGYHAHIYYRNPEERGRAEILRNRLTGEAEITLGRWRDRPVGPHPAPMFQAAFPPALFPRVVPWLMLNRQNLGIMVHPDTGNGLADHRDHALWLGERLPLDLSAFR